VCEKSAERGEGDIAGDKKPAKQRANSPNKEREEGGWDKNDPGCVKHDARDNGSAREGM
jgi:hypothetical protein